MPLDKSYTDKDLEAAFLKKSKELYEQKVSVSTLLQRECGNMYCGSVYGGLCGLLSEKADELVRNIPLHSDSQHHHNLTTCS